MASSMQIAALKAIDRGWNPIPVKFKSKTPSRAWKEFQDRRVNKDEIQELFPDNEANNMGIVTGKISGLCVLDVDKKSGGFETLENLTAEFGSLPQTPTAITGGGGLHFYFEAHGIRNSAGILGKGLDIRGDGGYVVCPPSVHESGTHYQWQPGLSPDEVPVAPIPNWLLDKLNRKVSEVSEAGTIEEGRRHDHLTSFAGRLLKTDIRFDVLKAALFTENEHCLPPLDHREIETLSKDLYGRYGASKNEQLLKFSYPSDWINEPEKETEWVVDGLIPSGALIMISSNPKVGKSTFSRTMSVSIAKGIPFLNRTVKEGEVLYLALEENLDQVKQSFRKLGVDALTPLGIYSGRPWPGLSDQLEFLIMSRKPSLVVIDTVVRLADVKVKISEYNSTSKWLNPYMYMAHESGSAICLLYHDRKSTSDSGSDRLLELMGSQGISATIDQLISLKKRPDGNRSFSTEGRFTDVPETVYQLDENTLNLIEIGHPSDLKSEALENQIIELLRLEGEMRQKKIQETIPVRAQTVLHALNTLVQQGTLNRSGSGKSSSPFRYSLDSIPSGIDI